MDEDTTDVGRLVEPDGTARRRGRDRRRAEPDVLLDVPELRVEEIVLDVEDLRAHVSVQADVLNLLRLSVGADVELGGVHLEIRGVEAQALLKVRLDKIAEIIDRVLTTIDNNPEIIDQIVGPLETAAGELAQDVGGAVEELEGALTPAASDLDRSVAEDIEDIARSDATPEEPTVAQTPETAPTEHAGGTSRRRLRRRRKQKPEEKPPP